MYDLDAPIPTCDQHILFMYLKISISMTVSNSDHSAALPIPVEVIGATSESTHGAKACLDLHSWSLPCCSSSSNTS